MKAPYSTPSKQQLPPQNYILRQNLVQRLVNLTEMRTGMKEKENKFARVTANSQDSKSDYYINNETSVENEAVMDVRLWKVNFANPYLDQAIKLKPLTMPRRHIVLKTE